MKPAIYFLVNSIDIERGGLTVAALKQASFFTEMGYRSPIITVNFNPRYPVIRRKLLATNKIHKEVEIRNLYEEMAGNKKPVISNSIKIADLDELVEGGILDKRKGFNAYRVYKNGLYIKYIALHEDDSLHFIDYFNENRYRVKRDVYNLDGKLAQTSYMDYTFNKPRQIIHFNIEGNAFLSKWNDPNNNSLIRIHEFENDGSLIKAYVGDDIPYKVKWLESIARRDEQSIFVTDARSTDELLLRLKHPSVSKVLRLHSTHLDKPYKVDSDIHPYVKKTIERLSEFDAVLLLTEEQKKDVITRLGENPKIHVVPHYHEKPTKSLMKSLINKEKTNNNLAVIVSRLSTIKRIEHSIKAFENVVKKIPDAQLEIWGLGTEENILKQLINELGLEKNVFLKGYAHNTDEIYEKALFSVLTSKREGFALSILESMSNKTPIISYNIKYGPNDMIKDNENGFIIEDGNIEQLSEKMIYFFENPKITKKFGEEAKMYVSKKFSKEVYKENWLKAIDIALKKF